MRNPFTHVGDRRFCIRRVMTFSQLAQMELSAEENVTMSVIWSANKLGLSGETVLLITSEKTTRHELQISLITRTRAQRFLAWITRSF